MVVLQESGAQPEVTLLHLGGGLNSCRRTQRYCYVYSLRRNQDPALRLHYCFLTAPPLFLHSLPSLISNCLNLPFGTQGRSRRLNEAKFLQTRHTGGPHRVLLHFTHILASHLSFNTLQSSCKVPLKYMVLGLP